MTKMYFKTSSGIKNIVGKDLITDKYVAIFELVKNSYDANATDVLVSFNNLNDKPSIIISDNGIGMSESDLSEKWLYLAYSEKKEGRENSGRTFVGSKGVGRFSCDRLGKKLELITKKEEENVEHILSIDWSLFENSLSERFENIPVEFKNRSVSDDKINSSYTILVITELRDFWNDDELNKVRSSLVRLKNPFIHQDGFNLFLGKDISSLPISKLGEFIIYSNITDILKEKSTTIEAKISDRIIISLSDRGKNIYQISSVNNTILKDVNITISINYLTSSAKKIFTEKMGVQPVNYGNVFVYRNNFRVYPYGNTNYDFLELNLRKTQGYNRYIGTREIIGYIDIQDENNFFMETSSRDNGFIRNIYLSELENFYLTYIHKPLEYFVNLIKWGEVEVSKDDFNDITLADVELNEREKFKKRIVKDKNFSIDYFDGQVDFEENKLEKNISNLINLVPKNQRNKVKQISKKLTSKVEELRKDNKNLNNKNIKAEKKIQQLEQQNKNLLITREPEQYGMQITHHFNVLAERLRYCVEDLQEFEKYLPEEDKNAYIKIMSDVSRTKNELIIFKDLLLKTNYDLRSNQVINWFEVAKWHFSNSDHLKINCSIDQEYISKWNISSNIIDFIMCLDNFYINAIEHSANYMELIFLEDEIIISNDSESIDDNIINKIFELGFSSKQNGTGIGLYQIKKFFNQNGFDITTQNDYKQARVLFKIKKKLGGAK